MNTPTYIKQVINGFEFGTIETNAKNRSKDRMVAIGTQVSWDEANNSLHAAGYPKIVARKPPLPPILR